MISVIIPVYNVMKYLPVCIDSVLAQTYTDIEIILVDDGSTDNSPSICDEYALKDNRIRVIHQANKGLSGARNTGVYNAKGDYYFFLDSDDCIEPALLETVLLIAEKTNASLVQINLKSVGETFKPDYDSKHDVSVSGKDVIYYGKNYPIFRFDTIEALYNLDRDNQNITEDIRLTTTVAWSKLYRKDVFEGMSFPEEIRLHEDQMTAHRRIVDAGGMVFVDIPLYCYRKADNNSLIRSGWNIKRLMILDCYDDRLKCVKEVYESSEDKARAKGLLDYLSLRLMICYFKNYCIASRNLKGDERKENIKMIMNRFKNHLSNEKSNLPFSKYLFFAVFSMFPGMFTWLYGLRK